MVCLRCRMVVKAELEKLDIKWLSVEPGRVETFGDISIEQMRHLRIALFNAGLELTDDRKNVLVEKIKNVIAELINYDDCDIKINFSIYLSNRMALDYTYLSNTFSGVVGTTIEHYIIMNKILRVKQLLCFQDLNLTEISWKMHYSSVAHLSTQFKKVTGITPSQFKHIDCNSTIAA